VYIATALLYLIALYNCGEILLLRQSTSSKLSWILVNLFIPIVGVPAYFLLGKNRIRGYTKRKQVARDRLDLTAQARLTNASAPEPWQDPEHLTSFDKIFSRYGSLFEPCRGHVDLHVEGAAAFASMFSAIEQANSYILVQYYIFKSDKLGQQFKKLLIDKAQQGVKVYVLYDDVGSFWLPRKFVWDMRRAGIRVSRFQPLTSLNRAFRLNFRNHRKLVVIDGRQAFLGGLNIGNEYHDGGPGRPWRDTQVAITGPAVQHLEKIFLEDWYFSARKKIRLSPTQDVEAQAAQNLPSTQTASQILQIIPTGPTDEDHLGLYLFLNIIKSAKRRLWIASPYFIPDPSTLRLLELRMREGLDVRILMPAQGDNHVVHWVSTAYGQYLAAQGCSVYFYTPGFMHQKVIVVDDSLTMVGSANFDNRTIFLNFEASLLVHDRTFNQQMTKVLEADFRCSQLAARQGQTPSLWLQLRTGLAMLLAPIL
jgi:cardiolipin synthase A/B